MNLNELPQARVHRASNWSSIWILPILALLISCWLAWSTYSQTGVDIQIIFESGDGIQPGKTDVIFKGMEVGKVKDLTLDTSGAKRGVIATVEMNKEVEPYLLTNTRFWLVKPSVTLAGVTGLETLVSGNYIEASPGDGESTRLFTALTEAPPLSNDLPGLHLTLKADRLGSLTRESPVFFRQMQVGRVKSYALSEDQRAVEIKVHIEAPYASLVRKHTRFWNASGVTVDADLSGVKVRAESLASLVAGGIAFATPEHRMDSPPVDPNESLPLYENFNAAQVGLKVLVTLSDFDGLQAGQTPVMYKGIQVGTLKALVGNDNLSSASAELALDPRTEDYLVEGTQFWVVKPAISVAGVTGLEALVKGNYIAVHPGKKGNKPKREFFANRSPPPPGLNTPGLHLTLLSNMLGSLEVGSPVLYRQIKVGSVQSYQLSKDRAQVVLGIHIEPEYASLVNSSTRFWNASGITLTGGLSGITVKSESLQSLLSGGIAFDTPDLEAAPLSKRVQRFVLYADSESAAQYGIEVQIRADSGDGLQPGTPIRYKGLEVGQIEAVELTNDFRAVLLTARITKHSERIARIGTKFWVVKPELSLVRAENLETVVTGPYLQVQPAQNAGTAQTQFVVQSKPPVLPASSDEGMHLVLSTSHRRSLKPGVLVTYRGMAVGRVSHLEFGATADRVLVHVLIESRYTTLVRSGSRFWHASGFGVDWSLMKGATIRTESIEAILEGGIEFATPDGETMGRPATPGQTFTLFDEANLEWLEWAPKIALDR